jgi:hypothetical protein
MPTLTKSYRTSVLSLVDIDLTDHGKPSIACDLGDVVSWGKRISPGLKSAFHPALNEAKDTTT